MTMARTAAEPVWMHVGCGGPVYFDLTGGWCWQCGAGPLHPYADDPADRYVHQDEILPSARAG
jgi:hypothetical protein